MPSSCGRRQIGRLLRGLAESAVEGARLHQVDEVPRRAQHDSGGDGGQGQSSSPAPGRRDYERYDNGQREDRRELRGKCESERRGSERGLGAARTREEEDRGEKE